MPDDPPVAESRARVAALREQLEAREGAPVRVIETHVSWVLLAGPLAYKLKKPVRLGFLDFTSLAERQRCCAFWWESLDLRVTRFHPAGRRWRGSWKRRGRRRRRSRRRRGQNEG